MTSFKKCFVLPMVLVAITFGTVRSASAEIVTGVLGAQSIVNSFNSMNSGTGLHYTVGADSGATQLKNVGSYSFADTSYYKWHDPNSFYTFCVEPSVTAYGDGVAKLNYANGTTKTTFYGSALTVGAAYLYKMFVTDLSTFYTDTTNVNAIGSAIRFLIGNTGDADAGTSWASNAYLQKLTTLNSQDYWNQIYDPDSFYSEIGNYSVFVMDVRSGGIDAQDYLYLANAANPYSPPAVPEPATMLIFGLGIAGLGLARRKRK